jgi:uncharacterized protein (TIGR02001 family)
MPGAIAELSRMPVAADMSAPMPAAPLFSGDVQFSTNFVARGISQSQGQPSVQGEIDYNSGDGVYAGLDGNSINWIDQLHPGDNVSLDADGWLGYRKHFGSDWVTKIGLKRIQFPGHYVRQSPPVDQPNATEAFGSIAWNGLSTQLNYAVTNYVGTPDSKGTAYLSVSASQPVGGYWTLDAGRGSRPRGSHRLRHGHWPAQFPLRLHGLQTVRRLRSRLWHEPDPGVHLDQC